MTIFYAVSSIVILYFLFALGGEEIKKIVGRKICAVCAAVSLTWVSLLVLKLTGFEINTLIIAILMGQSVTGLMFKLEEYFEKKKLQKFWLVRILVIAGGTLFVYWLLREDYVRLLLLLLVSVFLLPAVLSAIIPPESSKKKRTSGSKEYQKAVAKLEKLMEDCC